MSPHQAKDSRRFSAISCLLILVVSSISAILVISPELLNETPAAATPGPVSAATTYGTGLSGGPATLQANDLDAMESGGAGIAGMEKYINEYFVPANVHLVFLEIYWGANGANTSSTLVTTCGGCTRTTGQQSVSDWLSLGVKYHISTIFFFKQFGYFFGPVSWDQDFVNAYPGAMTVNDNGTNVPFYVGGGIKQKASAVSSSAPIVLTFGSNTGGSHYLVLVGGCSGTGGVLTTPTDSQSLTWTKESQSNHNHDIELWKSSATVGAAEAVTVHFTGSCSSYFAYVFEVSFGPNPTPLVNASSGFGSGTTASVGSYTPTTCSSCDGTRGTGSFVMSFANVGASGSCSVYPVQFTNSNPNHLTGSGDTVCGSYNNNWGYAATTTPITVPSGTWDEVSLAISSPTCGGCFGGNGFPSSSGWSISNPLVYRQLEQDLKQLYLWYGSYSSLIGVGEGATGDRNNYGCVNTCTGAIPIKNSRPFDNGTLYQYANSVFYQRLINPTNGHYLDSGNQSKLWAEFINDRPDVFSSTGTALMQNQNFSVYSGNTIIQRFYVQFGKTLNGFVLKAWLQKVGSPTKTLYETVYRDNASNLVGRPLDLASESTIGLIQNVSVSGVTTTGQWVSTTFSKTLEGGDYYWVAFTTHSGDASNYYSVNYDQGNQFQDVYVQFGAAGVTSATTKGLGSVLWLTTTGGTSVTVYPRYYTNSNNFQSTSTTTFQVSSKVKMNEMTFFTSDREYDPNNVSVMVSYPNATLLTKGWFNITLLHGDEGLSNAQIQMKCKIHCGTANSVSLVPGITYTVSFGALTGDNYAGSLGGGVTQDFLVDDVNPSAAGYLGQTTWPIFQLGMMTLEPQGVSNQVYVSQTDLFSSPGYVSGSEIAMRFKASSNENLQTVSFEFLKMPSNTNMINVTLRADNTTCLTGVSGTCSHPKPLTKAPVLGAGTATFSAINATFTSCASFSGFCAWANFTLSAKHSPGLALTSGNFYWLVIGLTSSTFSGTSTSATSTVLTDSGLSLATNAYVGGVLTYTSGPAAGESRVITANTATTITVSPAFSPAPTPGGGNTFTVSITPVLQRDVNPYKELVYYSSTDFLTTWGPPPDGPSDLSFKITTSVETISQLASQQVSLTDAYVAQSFASGSGFQLKGLWIQTVNAGYYNFAVTIRPDSGSDSPGTTILSTGTIPMNVTAGNTAGSQHYVSLSIPVNITASTKYWFVAQSVCFLTQFGGSCSSPSKVSGIQYRSDFGTLTYHYETSSDGSSWSGNTHAAINFIAVASDVTIKTYNTATLYTEILNENSVTTANIPVEGWNAWLNGQQANVMTKLQTMMNGLVGYQAFWYTGLPSNLATTGILYSPENTIIGDSGAGGALNCPPSWLGAWHSFYEENIANCQSQEGTVPTFWSGDAEAHTINILSAPNQQNWLPWSSFGFTQDNRGVLRPIDTRTDQLVGWPLTARNIVSFNDFSPNVQYSGIYNETQGKYIQSFGTILSRMQASGQYFGASKNALRVLWIGSSDDGWFPEFLTPALNVTFISDGYADQNLTKLGNFNQFNVIVGNLTSPTASVISRMRTFVTNGGGFVSTAFGDSPSICNTILGLCTNSTPATTTSTLTVVKPNKITGPYASLSFTAYWLRDDIINQSGQQAFVLLKDSNNNPYVTYHAYGSGKGVSIEQPYARLEFSGNSMSFDGIQYGSPRDSWISILINAIYYAGGQQSKLPILWETTYNQQQVWGANLQFSVDGAPGSPPLVWLSNNSTTKSVFDIHLNGTFYGVGTTWKAINMENMSVVSSGTGSDVHILTTVQAWNWEPIYIVTVPANLNLVYNNMGIKASSISSGMATYTTTGAQNQSDWLIVASTTSVTSVSSNYTGTISSQSTLGALNMTQIGLACTSVGSTYTTNLGQCLATQYKSQEGWLYDSTNHLLYIHFRQNSHPVLLTINQPSSSVPQYSKLGISSPKVTTSNLFSAYWTDSAGLSGYIFSWDSGIGSMVNDSFVAFSGTTNWSNVTKTIPSTIGNEIRWKVYAEDVNAHWNSTRLNCFVAGTNAAIGGGPYTTITDDCYDLLGYTNSGTIFNLGNQPNFFHVDAGGAVGWHSIRWDGVNHNIGLMVGYSNAISKVQNVAFTTLSDGLTSTTGMNSISWKPSSNTTALIVGDAGNAFLYSSGVLTPITTGVSTVLNRVVWSPDGTIAYFCGNAGTLVKYTFSGGGTTVITTGVGNNFQGCDFAPDGSLLLIAGSGGYVAKWDGATLTNLSTGHIGTSYSFQYVAFSRDGVYALITSQNNVRGNLLKWTTSGGAFTNVTSSNTNTDNHVVFAADDSYAYITSTSGGLEKELYNANTTSFIQLTNNRLRGIALFGASGIGFTVTFGTYPLGIASTTPSGSPMESGTFSITTAVTIAGGGYSFNGWTATGGVVVTSPSSASTTATVTSSGTLTANYLPTLSCGVH